MGRLHKKKFSEYAEATDNEEQQNEKEGEQANNVDGAADKSMSSVESEAEEVETTKIPKDPVSVDEPDQDEPADDDFQSLHEDEKEQSDKNGANKKVAPKRKSVQNAAKKNQDNDENVAGDSDDEPLNGSGVSVPAKRGRKTGTAKPKGKAGKAAAGGRGKGPKKTTVQVEAVDEESEEEEEYEVKDILDHKVERGATYYLIRWKGYNKDDDTWEPEATLSCPDIIEKYKKKTANNGTKATPKKSVSPGKKGGKRGAGKAASKEDPNKEWEVEKIIDYSEEKAGRVFRIRWKGFGPKNDTWEPEKNLYCNDLIKKFMKHMDSQKNISFKELREEPKKTKRLVNETAPRTNYHNPIGRKSKRSGSKKRVYYGDSDE